MSRALPFLAALLLAVGLALWQLWPAPLQPGATVVGNWVHPDCLGNHWLLVWVADQLSTGGSLAHNDRYYWPVGDAPVLAGNGNEGFLYWPLHVLLGWPSAVVAYALVVLVLNGLGGWAVARAAGADGWSALVATSVTGLAPYAVQEASSGRFTQADLAWLLFFLAAWLTFLRRPSPGRAVLAGALLATTAFFYWYYGFFGVLAGGLLLLAWRPLPGWRPLLVFSGTFLVLLAPWAWFFLSAWQEIPGTAELDVFPHPQSILEATPPRLPFLVGHGRHAGHAMPAPTWAVGLAGAALAAWRVRHDPASRGLLLVWAVFFALSLGPLFPHSPYELLYGLAEPLRRFWWPSRHVVVVTCAWGALGALGLAALARRHPGVAALVAVGVALSSPLLLARQGAPNRIQLSSVAWPARGYDRLASLEPGVLVEPPLSPQAAGTEQQLVYQFVHRMPLLGGHALWVDRIRPDAWDAFVADNSFLSELQRLERGELGATFRFEPADLRALLDRDVRWYGLNREYFAFPLRDLVQTYDALFDALFGQPALISRGLRIWDATRWEGQGSVEIPPFRWPAGVQPGGPEMPLIGLRPKSPVFDSLDEVPPP